MFFNAARIFSSIAACSADGGAADVGGGAPGAAGAAGAATEDGRNGPTTSKPGGW